MDNLTKDQRKKNMQAIKCRGSKIENLFAKALWNAGLRYRKNNTKVYGKPDFVFLRRKIAIFCDGEFWHGKEWDAKKKPATNIVYWHAKIERNIARDHEVNSCLKQDGWIVIRFWGKDITNNIDTCLDIVKQAYLSRSKI